jgi:hypothetical protein
MHVRVLRKFLRESSGSSESALVLIPLISLFLIISQVTVTIHARNIGKIVAQDAASSRALSGKFLDGDTFLHINSPDHNQNLDLIVSHSRSSVPSIFPGIQEALGRNPNIDVTGIAVIENQR